MKDEAKVKPIREGVIYVPPKECEHDWKCIKDTGWTSDYKCQKCGKMRYV